jgi:hypothetical protein
VTENVAAAAAIRAAAAAVIKVVIDATVEQNDQENREALAQKKEALALKIPARKKEVLEKADSKK